MISNKVRDKDVEDADADVRKGKLRLEWASYGYIEKGVVLATLIALALSFLNLYLEIVRTSSVGIKYLLIQNGAVMVVLALLWGISIQRFRDERARRLDSERNQWASLLTISHAFHRANHSNRDLPMPVAGSLQDFAVDRTVEALVTECDCIRTIFETIFGGELSFHVAIKAFVSEEGVVAIARDSKALDCRGKPYDLRRNDEVVHHIKENTDFYALLHHDEIVFASDDLVHYKQYRNTSGDWDKRYTATMVVPIRRKHANTRDLFELAGYLCIDCKPNRKTNIFCNGHDMPNEALQNIMFSFADSTFGIIKRAQIVDGGTLLPFREYVIDAENFSFVRSLNEELRKRTLT